MVFTGLELQGEFINVLLLLTRDCMEGQGNSISKIVSLLFASADSAWVTDNEWNIDQATRI